jgi:hypothetical protein
MTLDSLSSIERQQQILQFLGRQQRTSVTEIYEMFSIVASLPDDVLKKVYSENTQRVLGFGRQCEE